ncbi:MAG: type II secretion system protein GspD [bacterium]|nr:type II secretion system protein GspD [bacterium]
MILRSHPTSVLRAASLLAACLLVGCESSPSRGKNEQINMELFQDLIEGGTMEPAENFDEDAYFEQLAAEYADEPSEVIEPGNVTEDGNFAVGDEPGVPENPYLEFGSRIQVYDNGLIMKPFTFPVGMGKKVLDLMVTYGDFPVHFTMVAGAAPEGATEQPPSSVVFDLWEGLDSEAWTDPRATGLVAPNEVKLGDVVIVTASPQQLREVQYFIDIFAAEVRQIEIEAKIVEVTTSDSLDVGVRPVDDSTPIFGLPNPRGFVKDIDFSFPNSSDGIETLFSLGAVFDGVAYNAVLEAVAAYENVSIISRPKVAVRDGARAELVNLTSIPYLQINQINASGAFTTNIEYKDVGVEMYIIPRVIGGNTIILNIDIQASQQTGTGLTLSQIDGSSVNVITVPEIARRSAKTIVRLEPGQAVILGGLISERNVERETKFPILGDVPLLGNLFKSKFTEKRQTNVLFFIRPRILEGSDLRQPIDE